MSFCWFQFMCLIVFSRCCFVGWFAVVVVGCLLSFVLLVFALLLCFACVAVRFA